jgi:hypothetical protein
MPILANADAAKRGSYSLAGGELQAVVIMLIFVARELLANAYLANADAANRGS